MLSVLIVDNCPVLRQGLRQILKAEFLEVHIGEATTLGDATRECAKLDWGFVVLEPAIDGDFAIQAISTIRAKLPDTKVLVFTGVADKYLAVKALRSGAAAYLTKDVECSEIVAAIRAVLVGRTYVTNSVLRTRAEDASEAELARLSARERAVFERLSAGMRNTQIAAELNLSQKTIATYARRIREKLRLDSPSDLIHYVLERGLSEPQSHRRSRRRSISRQR